jgi:cysteine-rich repeat protein
MWTFSVRVRWLVVWLAAVGCGTHSRNVAREPDAASQGRSEDSGDHPNGSDRNSDAGDSPALVAVAEAGTSIAPVDAGDARDANAATMADPCAGLANLCSEAGASCMGNTLLSCAMNDAGCLVTTRTNCTRGGTNLCDGSLSPPACAVDPCLGLANTCATQGTSCEGTTLVTCAKNNAGCLVATRSDCTATSGKNSCGGSPAECKLDACRDAQGKPKPNVCASPQDSCAADYWVHCVADSAGCLIATRTDCTKESHRNICDAGARPPACGFDPCKGVTNCLTAGKSCDGVNLIDCAPNADGCLVKASTDCTQNHTQSQACDAGGATPMCTTCSHAAGCAGKHEGDTLCDGNVFQKCSDTDGNTCLNAIREDCGANFTCNVDPSRRCTFNGTNACSSALAATLHEPMSYGPFDTTGAGDDYSAYSCRGLAFGVQATSSDLLFAVDVGPKSVVTIGLKSPSGFTNNGARMLLLTRCDDDPNDMALTAEASCQAASGTSLSYANEGTTAVRVYLTVDANRANNADNVGLFGLSLDVHPFACGDGKRDGAEACDDANIVSGDGCTPDCMRETGFSCTSSNPSVCTKRPTDGICANVMCPALPGDAPANTELCCASDQRCGVAYAFIYGAGCLVRDQPGKDDASCPAAPSAFAPFVPTLNGCCRPDNKCGIVAGSGAGCIERSEAWANMVDGYGDLFYTGPLTSMSCTYR